MRSQFIAALCVVLAVGACAPQKQEFPVSRGDVQADSYGNYLSARLAASEHDLSDAARYYRASLDQDPSNTTLLNLAFFFSTSAGEIDEATDLAQRVTAKLPDDRAARLTLAIAALKRKDFNEARTELTKSAKGPFTSLTISLLDAWAAAGAGDSATAMADLKSVRTQPGTESLGTFHQALLLDLLGQTNQADASYRDALVQSQSSPRIVDAYGRFLERNGRSAEASALYAKLATESSLVPIASAGRARIAKGQIPAPLIASAEQGAAEALFGVAASLSDQSSIDISILYLRLALYLRPDLDLGNILLADRLETLEKYDDAITAYGAVGKDSPYYRLAAVETAVDQARLKQTDASIASLKSLTQAYPADIEAWTALGDTYRAAERFGDAVDAYTRAIKTIDNVDQKDWPLFYARAIAEERSNNWNAAEADLQQALKLSPDEAQVLNYLGYSWVDQGHNIPQALTMLEKARALRPYDGYIVDSVGWAYFRLGRYKDAATTLEGAVLLVPGDPTINDHLGDAYWRVGRKLDARFQWSHALAFGAEDDEKTKIEKKLKVGLDSDQPS